MQAVCRSLRGLHAWLPHRASPRRGLTQPMRLLTVVRFTESDGEPDSETRRDTEPAANNKALPKSLQEVRDAIRHAQEATSTSIPVHPLQPAFTRQREVLVGRAAMVGFLSACFWEDVLPGHPGILAQVSAGTGLPSTTIITCIILLSAWNIIGGLAPWSPTFSIKNIMDVGRRPPGPPAVLVSPFDLKRFWGVSGWGFIKANELFHGRLAMLGFAAALINEVRLGGLGPLAQIAYYMNVSPDDAFYAGVAKGFAVFALAATVLAYLRGKPGWQEEPGDEAIY